MKLKFIVLLIALLLLSIMFFFITKESVESTVTFHEDRKYGKLYLVPLDTINHNYAATDYLIFNNAIFFKDFNKQQIIKTDFKGNELGRYGSKGEGPRETLLIRGFDVNSNSYATIDARKNTISRISFNDSLIYSYKPIEIVNTGCFIGNDKVITKGQVGNAEKREIRFTIVDSVQTKEINISSIFKKEKNSDWIYDGMFSKTFDNGAIYVTHFYNKFIKFNSEGEIVFHNNFIYKVPKIILKQEDQATYPIKNDKPNVYSLTSNDKFIFFLSAIGDKTKNNEMIIDVYEFSNGRYFSSISISKNLDNYPRHIRISENTFFIFYENLIEIYDLHEN